MNGHIVVLVTAPSKKEAEKIGRAVVKEGLAACVNIIPGIRSLFRWKGKVDHANELLLVIKTKKGLFKELEKTIKREHSYTVPEIIALPIVEGSKSYLKWIEEVTLSK